MSFDKKTKVLFTVLLLLFLITNVSGADYTDSLNPSIPSNQVWGNDALAFGNCAVTPTGNETTLPLLINFDTIGTPKTLVLFDFADLYAVGSATFELTDGTGVISTGTIIAQNGTKVNWNGAVQYFVINFNTWTAGARVGKLRANLTLLASTITTNQGVFLNLVGSAAPNSLPIGITPDGATIRPTAAGSLFTAQPYITKYEYTITGFGGTGINQMSEVILSRPSNNLATNLRAYNTSGLLLYQSTKTDSTSSEDFFIIGNNYYLSMYIPLTGAFYNSSIYYDINAIPSSAYNLTPQYDIINYNRAEGLTVSGDTSLIKEIKYTWSKSGSGNMLYDNSNITNTLAFAKIGANWYQHDMVTNSFTIDKGISAPIGVTTLTNFGIGDYILTAYLTSTSDTVYSTSCNIAVTSANLQTLTIQPLDFTTGEIQTNSKINVLDIASSIWDNRTNGGTSEFYLPVNQKIYIVSKGTSGYITAHKNWTVSNDDEYTVNMIMYRGVTTPITNVSVRVSVIDGTDLTYIYNAKVTLLNDDSYFDSQSQFTNYGGLTTFSALPNTNYVISVSKSGYKSAGKIIASGAGGTTYDTDVILYKGANPTETPTPVPTNPSNYIGGNLAGGNITPTICRSQLTANDTLLDSLKNSMACAGITTGNNQGFGIAILIIFVLGIVGGKYGRGMGVVMGMSAGYVLSLAMGLVPLWTFIALIIFICLILATKIWGSK